MIYLLMVFVYISRKRGHQRLNYIGGNDHTGKNQAYTIEKTSVNNTNQRRKYIVTKVTQTTNGNSLSVSVLDIWHQKIKQIKILHQLRL